jgi:hypothetical protein
MPSFLDAIPEELHAELAEHFRDGTLHVLTLTSDGEGGYTQAATDHPIKGIVESYSDEYRLRTGVPDTDVRIIVLQYGVGAEPTSDSEITIEGRRYRVVSDEQDPAHATWTIRARPI